VSKNIDLAAARAALEKAWADIGSDSRPPAPMREQIEQILTSRDVTFKYILVTGYLAKFTNKKIHARALQAGSKLPGAYDARSLCHKVVVGFEKSKGNLFGLSNEPFLNKPARHPEHDEKNTQLKNKLGSKLLHQALEQAQRCTQNQIYHGLVHILRIAKEAMKETRAVATTGANMQTVISFINEFLAETDGGSRLVAVWGAFQALLSESGRIKVYSPNASDYFGKTAGDVEVYYDGVLVSASECKQRSLNLDDVLHGIKKSREKNVPEYLFVIASRVIKDQETAIRDAIAKHSREIDLAVVDIREQVPLLAIMLNPLRRSMFGTRVVELLRTMRKFESANAAATIWNRLTS
jgi:hypothetical protein